MKKPAPAIGLVIRYDFLWSHERDKGYQEGAKERPCVIVTAIVRKETGDTEVLVAPITHSPPASRIGRRTQLHHRQRSQQRVVG